MQQSLFAISSHCCRIQPCLESKLDSLVGLFGAGCQPTSTADPFGLRRICYGLVQILVENKRNLDLSNSLRLVANVQPIDIDDNQIQDVWQFVTRRLEQLLKFVHALCTRWSCFRYPSFRILDGNLC
ncbi:glycine--tRNA ligase, chloroplastic/mitochondrial 2-like [Phalaenopsis equestris]|uniref:glycine--tRNA ligase, chloroplastic/mitochondrial 2-like n=1 Tax=Phalaenopsis equestris TaxID=78828 RepID=UPI0009E208F3|nr:glycine--tRNA ligase, chloroplastic/mitochondrial 2-like [Phalaenopsis equestris]